MPANCKGARRCATEARHINTETSAVSHTLTQHLCTTGTCWACQASIPCSVPQVIHLCRQLRLQRIPPNLPRACVSDPKVPLQIPHVSIQTEQESRSEPTANSAHGSNVTIKPSAPGMHVLVE